MQKHVNLADIVKSFPTNIFYLLENIGVDTAKNEPLKVHLIFKLWYLIFTEPPRPFSSTCSAERTIDIRNVSIVCIRLQSKMSLGATVTFSSATSLRDSMCINS